MLLARYICVCMCVGVSVCILFTFVRQYLCTCTLANSFVWLFIWFCAVIIICHQTESYLRRKACNSNSQSANAVQWARQTQWGHKSIHPYFCCYCYFYSYCCCCLCICSTGGRRLLVFSFSTFEWSLNLSFLGQFRYNNNNNKIFLLFTVCLYWCSVTPTHLAEMQVLIHKV